MTDIKAALSGVLWGMSTSDFNSMVARAEMDDGNVEKRPIRSERIGGEQRIYVHGPIVNTHSFMSLIFGAVSSQDIASEIDAAQTAAEIVLDINSGGGEFSGGAFVVEAINRSDVPIRAEISGVCGSQAYMYAAATQSITALAKDNLIGSVGAMIETYEDENEKTFRSSNAKDKNSDADLQQRVNAAEEQFHSVIVKGRGVTRQQIIDNYGQGMAFLAPEALTRNMIDSISAAPAAPTTKTNGEQMSGKTNAGAENTVTAEQAEADKKAAVALALQEYKDEQAQLARDAEAAAEQAKADAIIREQAITSCEFAKARPAMTAALVEDMDYTAELAVKALSKAAPEVTPKGSTFADAAAAQTPGIDADLNESGEFERTEEMEQQALVSAFMVEELIAQGMERSEAELTAKDKMAYAASLSH